MLLLLVSLLLPVVFELPLLEELSLLSFEVGEVDPVLEDFVSSLLLSCSLLMVIVGLVY